MSDKKYFTHWGRKTYVSNCYWYHKYQDMQATVPTCEYYVKYGYCPCDTECKHFISREEVSEMVRNLKGGDSE